MRGCALLLLWAATILGPTRLCIGAAPRHESVEIRTECIDARVSLEGARLESVVTRMPGSDRDASSDVAAVREADPVRVVGRGAAGWRKRFATLRYTAVRSETVDTLMLVLRSEARDDGLRVMQRYAFARDACQFDLAVAFEASPEAVSRTVDGFGIELAMGSRLAPPAAEGLGGWSERLRAIEVGDDSVRELAPGTTELRLEGRRWIGLRSRFWTLLAGSERGVSLADIGPGTVTLRPASGRALHLRVYLGPVERGVLAAVDPSLKSLVFMGRSPPIQALCVFLILLLSGWTALVGHPAIAVILLSPTVKLLLFPITRIAERWQLEVDEVRTRLAPRLSEIRARYRGEERSRRIIELHRELGISMLFGLKGLLGVAIQLPFFIAAYHVLDESIALRGAGFLWIEDLSRPDRLAALPFALPFLGDGVHALPIAMTAVTLLASRRHVSSALSAELRRKQRRMLYLLAGGFFLLFYTFPAGMVLYWTVNNLGTLVFQDLARRRRSPHSGARSATEGGWA
jgi:YidC/Oxa1 family membrane protein insertase